MARLGEISWSPRVARQFECAGDDDNDMGPSAHEKSPATIVD